MKTTYIYNKVLAGLSASLLFLPSCSSTDELESPFTLSPDGQKTPINVVTNLTTDYETSTRAVNKKFESGDVLLAYIQTVTSDLATSPTYTADGPFYGLKTFTLNDNADNTLGGTNTTQTSSFDETIYWDDYSSTAYDLREKDLSSDKLIHGIRLLYGYCFNGGASGDGSTTTANLTTALYKSEGTLGWTVATDQSSGFKSSDLLWAKTKDPIYYNHVPTSRPSLEIPYTHAMSKMTIRIRLGEGYSPSDANFSGNVVTLKSKNTVAALTAPTATITSATTPTDITMHLHQDSVHTTNMDYSYDAIFVPTTLIVGDELAEISSIHGNKYTVKVTSEMLTAWNSQLTSNETHSGVNYLLTVSITKQQITVNASIATWDAVAATGKGIIQFANDVTTTGSIATELQANGFDVYQAAEGSSSYSKATTLTYEDGKWIYDDTIYWPNGTDKFNFRALAPAEASTSLTDGIGENLYWASAGDAIAPRTGDVSFGDFEHVMSKVSLALATDPGEVSDNTPAVNLSGATITVSNLYGSGTLNIEDGEITTTGSKTNSISGPVSDRVVVPQPLTDESIVTVTLSNGSTYSTKLNACGYSVWERGKHYSYTIHVEKEAITFYATIKAWDEKTGAGNANLEWD